MIVVELRCPEDPRTLLGKTLAEGNRPPITEGNLVELSCRSCRYLLEEPGRGRPRAVLHRYDLAGDLVETEAVWDGGG